MVLIEARDDARGYAVEESGSRATPASPWTAPSWDDIVRTHSVRVYRLAYRLTGNPHDAEDLTQEVFVRVFRSLSSYTPGTFEGWLHRITTNLFLDSARRRQRIRFEGLGQDAEGRLAGGDPSPAQAFDERHLDGDIQAALRDLPPEYRAAVVLCDIEGLSYEEIAVDPRRETRDGPEPDPPGPRAAPDGSRAPPPAPGRRGGRERGNGAVSHLGRRLTALVDGELSPAERDRAHAHLARCAACRAEAKESARAEEADAGACRPGRRGRADPAPLAIPGPGGPGPVRAPAAAGTGSATWRSVSRRAS